MDFLSAGTQKCGRYREVAVSGGSTVTGSSLSLKISLNILNITAPLSLHMTVLRFDYVFKFKNQNLQSI